MNGFNYPNPIEIREGDMISLPHCLPAPAGAIRCLLCEGIIGGKARYENHLLTVHGVTYNRCWLVDQTLGVTAGQNLQDLVEPHEGCSDEKIVDGEGKFSSRDISDEIVTMGTEKREARKRRSNVKLSEYDVSTNRRKLSKHIVDNVVVKENQSHQKAKELVKSALRGCQVTLRNCNLKYEDDENHNLPDQDTGSLGVTHSFTCSSRSKEVSTPEVDLSVSSNLKNGGGTILKPNSKLIKISETGINYVGVNGHCETKIVKSEDDCDWFDGNKFSCKKCKFTSTSLDSFFNHVKCFHKTTLAKFSGCYTKTSVQYQCKFCMKEVYHERSVLKEHLETHLLSLDQYAIMYNKKSPNMEADDPHFQTKIAPCSDFLPPLQKDPSHTVTYQSPALDLSPSSIQELSPALPHAAEDKSLSSHPQKILASPNSSDFVDMFVYVCPFPGCDFQTDLAGMKCGPAAEHGIAVHQVGPVEIKKLGLKWKRVLRSRKMGKRMVQM